eukprot:SAG31_NODE_852_length_11515_cov_6.636125_2_plen_71_part_00
MNVCRRHVKMAPLAPTKWIITIAPAVLGLMGTTVKMIWMNVHLHPVKMGVLAWRADSMNSCARALLDTLI